MSSGDPTLDAIIAQLNTTSAAYENAVDTLIAASGMDRTSVDVTIPDVQAASNALMAYTVPSVPAPPPPPQFVVTGGMGTVTFNVLNNTAAAVAISEGVNTVGTFIAFPQTINATAGNHSYIATGMSFSLNASATVTSPAPPPPNPPAGPLQLARIPAGTNTAEVTRNADGSCVVCVLCSPDIKNATLTNAAGAKIAGDSGAPLNGVLTFSKTTAGAALKLAKGTAVIATGWNTPPGGGGQHTPPLNFTLSA